MKNVIFYLCFALFLAGFANAQPTVAPTPTNGLPDFGITKTVAVGEVKTLDTTANSILLKTKDGEIGVILSAKTIYKRVPAENPSLATAVAADLSEITVGDRLMVLGQVSDDKKSVPAKQIVLISKSDLQKKLEADRDAWRNGVTGKVSSVNPARNEIIISVRGGFGGEKAITLSDTSNAKFLRYAQNSIQYNDAKPSNFSEVRVGDEIRARGTKSVDGLGMTADAIISGTFKQVGGTITAIDPTKREVTIKEVGSNKSVVIAFSSEPIMRKFPAEFAQMMATRGSGGAGGNAGFGGMRAAGGSAPQGIPTGGTGGQPGGQGGPGGGARRGGSDDMLERFPAITLAELKIGDGIGVLASGVKDANRVTAFKLFSGVEPFLKAPQSGGATGRPGQGGNSPNFNIPGLDSLGAP